MMYTREEQNNKDRTRTQSVLRGQKENGDTQRRGEEREKRQRGDDHIMIRKRMAESNQIRKKSHEYLG